MGLCRGVPFVSFRCLGSKPGYQPKQPKELLMCEVWVCNWNDKRKSYRDCISSHSTKKTKGIRGIVDFSNEEGVSSETTLFTFYIFLPPGCGAGLQERKSADLWVHSGSRRDCSPVREHDAAPLTEIRQVGIERLRSMSHYGECRGFVARVGWLQSWLSSRTAQHSHNCFLPIRGATIRVGKPCRIYSGLTVDSMSNMLSKNNEAGHQPFHLTHFHISRATHLWILLFYENASRSQVFVHVKKI